MSKLKALSTVFIGAAVFAVIAGAVVFRAVAASAPDASSMIGRSVRQQADSFTANLSEFGRPGPGGGLPGGYANEDLANALGITVEELEAAYQTAQNAALEAAVESGTITQAQADSLREKGFAFPLGGHWGGWLSESGIDYDALLAEALGVSEEDLQAAYTTAFETRIDQAVADGNLTEEQAELMKGRRALFSSESFITTMQTAFEDAVNQAVDAGVITQAQADLILENAAQFRGGDMGIPGFGAPDGFGRGGGHHGWGERMPGGPMAPDQPSTSPSSESSG